VDILVRIEDDRLLHDLELPKGGMTLVDRKRARLILDRTAHLKHHKSSGGSSANTVTGLARLGMEVGFVGTVGKDEFGHFFKSDLVSMSVDTHLFQSDTETGKSISLISADTERTFATYLGAANELFKSDINETLLKGYDYLLIEAYLIPYRNLIESVFKSARSAGLEIVMDLSNFNTVRENRDYIDKVLKQYVDIVLANEDEARTFTGSRNPVEALSELAKICRIAVVKCGERGSHIQQGSRQVTIDPVSSRAIDTTGAGDLYASGFLYGLMNGYPIEVAGKMGSCIGGKVVEVIGARMQDQKWAEIDGLIRDCVVS
jgi:sugar/nucleoside kinase (ribokinase family)